VRVAGGEVEGHAVLAGASRASRHETVLIAESTAIFRSAVRSLVEGRLDVAAVDVADLKALIAATASRSPGLALIDFDLPPLGGVAAISYLVQRSPSTRVVAWLQSPTPATVYEAIAAGAVGCVEKDLGADELCTAISQVAAGEAPFSPKCAALLVTGIHEDAARRRFEERAAQLSRREREVLGLLAEGLRNREIASRLCITEATVKRHVSSVLRKLDAPTRRAAIQLYEGARPLASAEDKTLG
jgi:DNA-binding NarL/FixJ family response regulator